jgi:uncharacterized membrane protein HdeD (DUF308 family)
VVDKRTYALVDGAAAIGLAVRSGSQGGRWGWLLFEGVIGVAAALFTAFNPGITALVLMMVIATWAALTGVAEIVAAVQLRRQVRGEWLLAASGVLSVVFGVLTAMFPGAGALALVTFIGAYSIAFGLLLTVLGFRVRSLVTREDPHPVGVTPKHA